MNRAQFLDILTTEIYLRPCQVKVIVDEVFRKSARLGANFLNRILAVSDGADSHMVPAWVRSRRALALAGTTHWYSVSRYRYISFNMLGVQIGLSTFAVPAYSSVV